MVLGTNISFRIHLLQFFPILIMLIILIAVYIHLVILEYLHLKSIKA